MTDDLAAFLTARLDEDEAAAKAAAIDDGGLPWTAVITGDPETTRVIHGAGDWPVGSWMSDNHAAHIARHDPARVLREVAAGRAILAEHQHQPATISGVGIGCQICAQGEYGIYPEGWCQTVRALSMIASGHPDYRQEWAPDAARP